MKGRWMLERRDSPWYPSLTCTGNLPRGTGTEF